MTLASTSGSLPPPIIEVLSTKEVMTSIVIFLVAFFGALAAALRWLAAKFAHADRQVQATFEMASQAKDQVTNNHRTNLRDDLDEKIAQVQEQVREGFSLAHQLAVDADKRAQDRDERMAGRIDEMSTRVENLRERANAEHDQIRQSQAKMKDRLRSLEDDRREEHELVVRPED